MLSCSWILIFLCDLGLLITMLISCYFPSYCFLTTIFHYSLLTNRCSHTTSHTAKIARWECLEMATTHHASTKSSTEKIIIIKTHSKLCKRIISIFLLFFTTIILLSHTSHHSKTWMTKTSSKEVIIIIEKTFKRIFSSKEFFKYIISIFHIKRMMSKSPSTKIVVWTFLVSSSFNKFSSILIVTPPLFLITQNLIGIWYYLKNFFGLFFIVRIFIRMVLQW